MFVWKTHAQIKRWWNWLKEFTLPDNLPMEAKSVRIIPVSVHQAGLPAATQAFVKIWTEYTGVNFINIKCTNFSYKCHFGSFHYIHVTGKKSCQNDVRTKNLYVWRWWNWLQVENTNTSFAEPGKYLMHSLVTQAWAKSGPRATCGPPST